MQKTISGRVAATDTMPFNYTSPMDTMIKITNNIFDDTKVILGNNNGLVANDENNSSAIGPIYSISDSGNFAGFTRLGISADFRSWLTGLDVVTGTYGLKVLIYTDVIDAPGSVRQNAVYELTFSSADMIGNPYQFESYFYQEKVFDISNINNINKIDIYFYQDGQFKDGTGKLIDWQYKDELLGLTKMPANLFVDNVKVYLGYETGRFTDETLMLFTSDSLSYHYKQYKPHTEMDLTKTVSLRWINKVTENEFQLLNGKNLDENKFEVRWFRYNIGYETIDQYAGKDWERVDPMPDDAFVYSFSPDVKKQTEQIKVIGLIKEQVIKKDEELSEVLMNMRNALTAIKIEDFNTMDDYYAEVSKVKEKYLTQIKQHEDLKIALSELELEEFSTIEEYNKEIGKLEAEYLTMETMTPYYSNLLVFENEEEVPNAITVDASNALTIVCMDNSEGNYFLYDQNGAIIDEGQGQGYLRTVEARYYGAIINESLGKIDYLRWYFPDEIHGGDTYTMILNDLPVTEIADYYGIDYVMSERGANFIDATTGNLNTAQTYSIKNYFNLTDANNTIRCVLSINGVEYEATKEFLFGKAGTNGSNATFVLSFKDNKDALVAAEGEEIAVKVQLYDANNSRVGPTAAQAENIEWSWYRKPDKQLIGMRPDLSDKACVILSYLPDAEGESLDENYHILKAKYVHDGIGLEAYLPIPIKRDNKYTQFEGAKQVIYNHNGTPTYYPKEYKLHEYRDSKHYEVEGLTWTLKYYGNTAVEPEDESDEAIAAANAATAMTTSLIPKLKESNSNPGYVALSASTFYVSGLNDKVCVSCSDTEGNILWSQPILIMQSQYDFAMLNSWDGGLTIDEENGIILSTMLGAGRKNDDNTFSGVLIGDIQQGTDLDSANNMTGVYGYHHGVQSYSLKEDGTATFGVPSRGQIQINYPDEEGKPSSTIKSASYETEKTGMLLDLDDGILEIKNDGQLKIKMQPDEMKGPYLIINSVDGIPLMEVGKQDYFLQSHSFGVFNSLYGTSLNLNDGSFFIKGQAGSVAMSGNFDEMNKNAYDLFKIIDSNKKVLIEMDGNNNYYLQSSTYDKQVIKTIKHSSGILCQVYAVPDSKREIKNGDLGAKLSFSEKVAISSDNTIYNTKIAANGDLEISSASQAFQATTIKLDEKDSSGKNITYQYSAEEYKLWFILNLIPVYEQTNRPSGLKIDLNAGSIAGYDLYLRGMKKNSTNENQSFTLDSSADNFPFTIGKDFKINWDGTLTCNKVNSLNDDGRDNYAISISNNFYVTKSGGAGGSSANFGYGHFGGGYFGGNAKTASYADKAGQAGWAGYALELKQGAPFADSFTAAEGLQALKDIKTLATVVNNNAIVLNNLINTVTNHTHKFDDYYGVLGNSSKPHRTYKKDVQ